MNKGRVCVGGHDLDRDFRSLRLLTKGGMNLKEDDGIAVGQIWDLDYDDHAETDPPHIEDVLVKDGEHTEDLSASQLRALILENETPWKGAPDALFDGTVAATANGRVYLPDDGPLPNCSTGYWIPGDDLIKRMSFDRAKFVYAGGGALNEFTWAGMEEPPPRIASGRLTRVSLARWYSPSSAPSGYYTQISGVY
jgi:hypothetical protein